jgi:hypothetical protein
MEAAFCIEAVEEAGSFWQTLQNRLILSSLSRVGISAKHRSI